MEQPGIYKIDLYEFRNLKYIWVDANTIYSQLYTGGSKYTIEFCNFADLTQNTSRGANGKLVYNYSIGFKVGDLTTATAGNLKMLNTNRGWFAVLYLSAGRKIAVPAPLIFAEGTFESRLGNSYYNILANEIPAVNDLLQVSDTLPVGLVPIYDTYNEFILDTYNNIIFEP